MIQSLENERNDSTAQPSAPVELENECIKPPKSLLPTIPSPHQLKVPNEREISNSTEFTPNVPQFLTVSPTFSTRFPSLHYSGINKARHSIDIRALPSYIARKRQSILDSKLIDTLVEVATSPFGSKVKSKEKEDDGKPLFEEPAAPTLSLGERVALVKTQGPEFGTVRWIGRMPQISPQWTVGVEFDNAIGSGDGQYDGRRYFTAKENFAKFIPLSSLTKVDNYVGRPRSGTLLSRMSVQLKPGQLISVQRTTNANRLPIHCALNAPHHINHDVHIPNMRHCLCNNCNHPCAHLCRTKKPKGKKSYMSHMCHFSQKPHARMCCGGEELLYALNPKHFDLLTQEKQFYKRQAKNSNFSWTSGNKLFGKRLKNNHTDSNHHLHNHHSHSHHNHRHHLHHNHQKHNHHNYHPTHKQLDKSPTCNNPSSLVHLDKNKFGSQLSISSLPSTTSPCEVFIARGALTDESDLDESDDDYDDDEDDITNDNFSTPIRTHKHTLRSDLRSLVLCLVRRKRHKDKSSKSEENKKGTDAFINSSRSNSSRSRNRTKQYDHKNRGLSETPELKVSSYCSHCHSSSKNAVSASSSTLELDTLRVRSECSSAPSSLLNLSKPAKTDIKQLKSYTPPVIPPINDTMVAKSCFNEEKETSDTSIGNVSNQSSGQQIITKAEIETLQSPQTLSGASSHSPRRKRKGPAPAPPMSPSLSSNSKSSKDSAQLLQSTNSTQKRQSKQSAYSTPASTLSARSTLTRSLSERRQNKIDNMLNIFTSCSSEANLQELAFKSKSKLLANDLVTYDKADLIYDLLDYNSEVPAKSDLNANELSKNVSVQVNLYCWNHGLDMLYFKSLTDMIISNANPFISNFVYDQNSKSFHCPSMCNHICLNSHHRSSSLPSLVESKFLNSIKNDSSHISDINGAIADVNFKTISKDLAALLSPKQSKSKSQLIKSCNFKHISQSMNLIALDNTTIDGHRRHCHHCFYHCSSRHTHFDHLDFNYYPQHSHYELAKMCVKSMPNIWSTLNNDKQKHSIHSSKHGQRLLAFPKSSLAHHREKDALTTSTSGHSLSLLSSPTLTEDTFDNFIDYQTNLKQTCNWSSDSEIGAHPYSKIIKSKLVQKDVSSIFSHLPDNDINSKCFDYSIGLHKAMFNSALHPSDCKNLWQEQMNYTNSESLMHDLELAIAQGQHRKAASLARQLAFKKVSCRLNQLKHLKSDDQPIIVYLYIKDKSSHKGPIPIQLYSYMTVKQLKLKIQNDFGLPKASQQWIFGKCLATNEDASLATYGITSTGCSIFLYLLSIRKEDWTKSLQNEESNQFKKDLSLSQTQDLKDKVEEMKKSKYYDLMPLNDAVDQLKEYVSQEKELKLNHDKMKKSFSSNETTDDVTNSKCWTSEAESLTTVQSLKINGCESKTNNEFEQKSTIYNDLVNLDDLNLVTNYESLECPICLNQTLPGEGVVLRDCLHTFCKKCLVYVIQYSSGPEVKCPFRNVDYLCNSCLQDREVKALISPELYQLYLHRSMAVAESKTDKSFHCKTIDCLGWCEYDDNVNLFCCPVCGRQNCLTCQAIHENMNCKQYQDQLNNEAEQNEEAKRTKKLLEKMLATHEALRCPRCTVIVIKKWGCDWVKCSMCQTEICWVTKGPRWGPKGRGDTSGGCKCMINGQRCHLKCNYCH